MEAIPPKKKKKERPDKALEASFKKNDQLKDQGEQETLQQSLHAKAGDAQRIRILGLLIYKHGAAQSELVVFGDALVPVSNAARTFL